MKKRERKCENLFSHSRTSDHKDEVLRKKRERKCENLFSHSRTSGLLPGGLCEPQMRDGIDEADCDYKVKDILKKRHILVPCALVAASFLIISKAISANINPEIGAPIDPGYMGGTAQQYSEPEDVRRPTDEPPSPMPEMTSKMVHDIEVMEVRHFRKKMPDGTNEERLTRLEERLTGRDWSTLPLKDRMRRIRLASQRITLRGTSIPANLRGVYAPNRVSNDSIPLIEGDDDVGIIDGLMRLYNPQLYYTYKSRKERMLRYQD